jgi:hypothetical protein
LLLTHIRGFWSPEILNQPEHYGERGVNSIEILAWLTSAYRVTKNIKFKQAFKYLAEQHNYKNNIINARLTTPNEVNFSDDELIFFSYLTYFYSIKKLQQEGLLNDPSEFALEHFMLSLERTYSSVKSYKPSFYAFVYAYATNNISQQLVDDSLWTLRGWPLEQIQWPCFNSHRLDILKTNHQNRFYKVSDSINLLPYDERVSLRFNADTFTMDDPSDATQDYEPSRKY